MQVDEANRLIALAAENAQAALDAAQAVELSQDEELALLLAMQAETALPEDLDESNIEDVASAQKEALERGLAFRKTYYRAQKKLD